MVPTIFISYSHDSEVHKDWVLQLATRLRSDGVDVLLDLWNVKLGQDLAAFMESGLSESSRVVSICSDAYIKKSNNGKDGVGYEKRIITAELLTDQCTNWVIPIIRNNDSPEKVPTFLKGRLHINFKDDNLYEHNYERLLRELLNEPVLPIPPIGNNPFKTAKSFAEQKVIPDSEKYLSPAVKGAATFDYSNNNGCFFIGQNELMFELNFSKSSDKSIYIYNDPASIKSVAVGKNIRDMTDIADARHYDASSRVRRLNDNQVGVLQNVNGFYAAIKILNVKDDTRGSESDEVTFEYLIQTNGSPDFTSLKVNV